MNVAATPSVSRGSAIQKAWIQWSLVAAGVGIVVLSVSIVLSPSLYAMVVEQALFPRYETTFGFRGGRGAVNGPKESNARYAIVEVTPGGILDGAGLRPGDIPVDYHNGVVAFYVALCEATRGNPAEFEVVSRDDPSWESRRSIRLPP